MKPGAVAWLALACAGCLGREVVGVQGERQPECHDPPVHCDEDAPAPELGPFPEARLAPPVFTCAGWAELDELPARRAVLACIEVELDIPAWTTVRVEDAVLEDVRLHVDGGEGSALVLSASLASRLHVTLDGHAWLVVDGRSVVDDLYVEASPTIEGIAVTLGDADVSRFAIGAGARAEVRLEGARLEDGAIDTGDLVSAEGTMTGVHLRAAHAILAASLGTRVHAEITEARLLNTRLVESDIARCGRLRLLGSTLERSAVAACDAPVTLAGSTMIRTTVHGALESSGSAIHESWLRPGAETLFFADSSIERSAFCDTERLIAESGTIACVSCAPPIADISLASTYVLAPECPSLEAAAAIGVLE